MSVPTSPGWYWWTDMFGTDHCAKVYEGVDGLRAFVPGFMAASVPIDKAGGTFGPRLPSPERLEAMEKVARVARDFVPFFTKPGGTASAVGLLVGLQLKLAVDALLAQEAKP